MRLSAGALCMEGGGGQRSAEGCAFGCKPMPPRGDISAVDITARVLPSKARSYAHTRRSGLDIGATQRILRSLSGSGNEVPLDVTCTNPGALQVRCPNMLRTDMAAKGAPRSLT
jgi:hypothetical protein